MSDRSTLLRDTLAESAPTADTLIATLRAVRGRRWKRKMRPVVALLAIGFAWLLPEMPWRSSPAVRAAREGDSLPVTPLPLFVILHTRPLDSSERVRSVSAGEISLWSDPRVVVRASDEELLALAGGQGVGLLRREGRAELLIAQIY